MFEIAFVTGLLLFLASGSLARPGPNAENTFEYARGLETIAKWVWPLGLVLAAIGLVGILLT